MQVGIIKNHEKQSIRVLKRRNDTYMTLRVRNADKTVP